MEDSKTVLKRTFALVADRKEKTVVLLDIAALVRRIPAEVISNNEEAVIFATERRFIDNKEEVECEADSLVSLNEVSAEDEDQLQQTTPTMRT
jgi:hypothetical protein